MGSPILKCKMSKTFTLFTVYFRHTIPNDYRCSFRIHKIAGQNPGPFSRRLEMSLCQPSCGWGSKEREIGSVFHMLCPRYIGPLIPLLPYSLGLYLSRRWCNSRFPLHTTIQYYLIWAQNSLHLAIMGRTERTWVVRIYAYKIGAYLQWLRLDCIGAQAAMSFCCWPHMSKQDPYSHDNLWFGVTMAG